MMAAGDVYAGSYQCGSAAWLLIHIEKATSEGVDAIFHFLYPSSTQHGAYAMHGEWDKASSQILSFEPAEWLWAKAVKVQKVGIMGIVSENGESFAGEIMHAACGKFQVNRTRVDVTPPETTVFFADADGTPNQFEMVIKAPLDEADEETRVAPIRRAAQMIFTGVGSLAGEAREARQARREGKDVDVYGGARVPPPASPPQQQQQPQQQQPQQPQQQQRAPPTLATASSAVSSSLDGTASSREAQDSLAEQLWVRIANRRYEEAYELWSYSCLLHGSAASERSAAATDVIGRVLRSSDSASSSAGGVDDPQETASFWLHVRRHMLQSLAVFGGQPSGTVGRAIAATLSADGLPQPEVAFAEAQLALALNRSGCKDDDETLRAAEESLAAGDVEAAQAGYASLVAKRPEWAFPHQRLGDLAFRKLDDKRGGIGLLRLAADKHVFDVFSWVALGHALRESSETRSALSAFKQAQAWHPTMAHIRRMRQWMTAVEGQLAHAAAQGQPAV